MRPRREIELVMSLVRLGVNDCEIARRTGIPRTTVRDWRWNPPKRSPSACSVDHAEPVPKNEYAYLLGMYLGDGCLSATHRPGVWALRIFTDARYPRIIDECCQAMEAVLPGKNAHRLHRKGMACIQLSMYSKHWICLFPQHGPGRKHLRRIALEDWQAEIVASHRRQFIRGLIHSDGCRHIACERKRGNVRYAPRYLFSNRSDDIKALFCESCTALGVHWTRPDTKSIAIYRLASVAILDEFVGPKS
jgi:hypothetical protein